MKRYLCTVLALLISLSGMVFAAESIPSVPSVPTGGDVWDGTATALTQSDLTEKDGTYYYKISTAEQLAYVAQQAGDWLGYNYILANDLILNDTDLFADDLDYTSLKRWTAWGNNQTTGFSGIFDGAGHTISGFYGNCLFRLVKGTVMDLTVVNSRISSCAGLSSVGGITGAFYGGRITGCTFSGRVSFNGYGMDYASGVGGIVGEMGSSSSSSVYNCTVFGSINSKRAGGIVGNIRYGSVSGCTNYASVTSTSFAGGIAGAVEGSVSSCKNYGDVIAEYAGGIAASGSGSVSYSKNYADVTGTSDSSGYVGGIRGLASEGAGTGNSNYGDVSGGIYTGGIAGVVHTAFSVTYSSNHGSVTGKGTTGGIAGECGKVEHCANTGFVRGGDLTGGIAGKLSTATDCYNVGAVVGTGYVGGISAKAESNTFTTCYNAGPVGGGTNVGAIAGKSDHIWSKSRFTNCYYEKGRLTAFPDVPDGTGVTGLTASEMKAQASFTGFDFSRTWNIGSSVNGGYPYFRSGYDFPELAAFNGIFLERSALTMGVGDRAELFACGSPVSVSAPSFTWESDDSDIATVSNGVITAKAPGTAVITVSAGGFSEKCTVTVSPRHSEEYTVGGLSFKDASGTAVGSIPEGDFTVSASLTGGESAGNAMVILACYNESGKMLGIRYAFISSLPEGKTENAVFDVDIPGVSEVRIFPLAPSGKIMLIGNTGSSSR